MTAGSIAVPSIVPLRLPNGKPKNVIDTCTPIEIRTETPNAEIYFTIDGSKPEPFAALGTERSTIKYTKPFKLREGKKQVKAVALSRDGTRESHIVTKTFEIEKCDALENQENKETKKNDGYEFIDELERERKKETAKKRGILKKIVDANNSYRSEGGGSDNESSRYQKETKFLGKRFGGSKTINFTDDFQSAFNKSANGFSNEELNVSRKYNLPDSSVQALRLQREIDFLKCIYCFANRPNDPHARFCTECGKNLPLIPQTKLIPPESGKLGTCFFCKSIVPFNTSICVICENPITPQLQPQASIKLQGKVICPNCTTANPANYTSCVACENKLVPGSKIHPVDVGWNMASTVNTSKAATCGQCFRVNREDARFCDWCGAKPQKQVGPLACGRCGANNNPYCKFCIACGSLVQPPSNQNPGAAALANGSGQQSAWLAQIDSKAMQILNKQYSSTSTQTYGLYYTSSKGLENKTVKEEKALKIEKEFSDRKPALTAVSAGRGFWRQQMDHVCAHLKAYAQNNPEFRASVAEPRLGKISTAKVDIDSAFCTLTLTYPIRNNSAKDAFNSSALIDQTLSNHAGHFKEVDYDRMAATVAGRYSSLSEDSVSEDDGREAEEAKKKKPIENLYDDRLTGEDRQLLKELGTKGRGRPKEVRNLLKDGANPNAKTKEGLSMLHLAVRNKHFECVPVLVEAKAELDARIPPKGNTILHEAVLMDPESNDLIQLLLDYGAKPTWKNSKNETYELKKAYDLAIKEKKTSAMSILNSHVGNDMMSTYLKSKSVDIKP